MNEGLNAWLDDDGDGSEIDWTSWQDKNQIDVAVVIPEVIAATEHNTQQRQAVIKNTGIHQRIEAKAATRSIKPDFLRTLLWRSQYEGERKTLIHFIKKREGGLLLSSAEIPMVNELIKRYGREDTIPVYSDATYSKGKINFHPQISVSDLKLLQKRSHNKEHQKTLSSFMKKRGFGWKLNKNDLQILKRLIELYGKEK